MKNPKNSRTDEPPESGDPAFFAQVVAAFDAGSLDSQVDAFLSGKTSAREMFQC